MTVSCGHTAALSQLTRNVPAGQLYYLQETSLAQTGADFVWNINTAN